MKNILQKIIKRRNPHFSFDTDLNAFALYQFMFIQLFSVLRGLKVMFFFKKPSGLL
ncbi:MAG TPA: hypothetical protein VLB84_04285 [Bacteroidia bacterium]|nr:hypothetical protein [Bacteroidia bacterium]